MHKLLLNEVLFIIGQSLPYCSHLMLLLMNRSALPLLLMNRPALSLLELITMLTIDDRKGFKYSTTAGISSLRNCKNTISKQRRPPREEHCTAGSTPDVPKHPPGTVIDSSLCTSFYNPMGGHELVPWHKGAGRQAEIRHAPAVMLRLSSEDFEDFIFFPGRRLPKQATLQQLVP